MEGGVFLTHVTFRPIMAIFSQYVYKRNFDMSKKDQMWTYCSCHFAKTMHTERISSCLHSKTHVK